jgi:hypothetical protein
MLTRCTSNCPENDKPALQPSLNTLEERKMDELNNVKIVADSIQYRAVIASNDPTIKDYVKTLKHGEFIDFIFESLYNGKLKAYSFENNKLLSLEEIKSIEKQEGFKRELVGNIFFNEQWLINEKTGQLYKKVNNMVFGYELYNSTGDLKGYKPMFKVVVDE